MDQVSLSVVIGTRNRLPVLKQCLDSLIGKLKVTSEIIVIDAGSTDGTLDYVEHLQGIRLIRDGALIGQARSLNRVIRLLESKYVCWLSDDNIIAEGMLDVAVKILEENARVGLVGLKVKDLTGPNINSPYIGGIWSSGILNCNQGLTRTALMQELGGFDEEFRDYGIDGDLTTRVLLEGYQVVFTKKVVIHHLRDRETISWTDSTGRKQKKERARQLYRQKYGELIDCQLGGPYDKEKRVNSPWLKAIHYCYASVFMPLLRRTGLVEKDWRILIVARFISKFDFFLNIGKPYYLVQRIPGSLLRKLSAGLATKTAITK